MTSSASVREQAVAGGGDHDRIEHQGRQPFSRIARATRRTSPASASMPGLERRRWQVLGQGDELRADHGLGHRLHGAHADGYSAR